MMEAKIELKSLITTKYKYEEELTKITLNMMKLNTLFYTIKYSLGRSIY